MSLLDSSLIAGVSGLAVGAGLMYALDPDRGRARRAHLRDRVVRAEHHLATAWGTAKHDLRNRSRGLVHDVTAVAHADHPDDDVLAARVHARLGRAIPHPGGVEVGVKDGVVTLRGPVLRAEVEQLEREVRHVRGVHGIINRCKVRDEPGTTVALQGVRTLRRIHLSPGGRLLGVLGVAGLAIGAALALRAR